MVPIHLALLSKASLLLQTTCLRQERGRFNRCVWSGSFSKDGASTSTRGCTSLHYCWSSHISPCFPSSNRKTFRPFPGTSLLLLLFRSVPLLTSAQQQWNQLFELESKTPAPLHLAFQTFPIWATLPFAFVLPSQLGTPPFLPSGS